MDRLEFHPLANLFPLMTDRETNDLGDDMLAHGQREPIWKYEGMILDGRNRYNACLPKGIEPRFEEYRGDDPVAFVVSLNLHRRHLDDAQRAMIAAKLATMKRGDNQHSPNGETSQAKAARLLNVSKRRVERTREVIDKGVPDLVDAVENGEVTVSAASEFAKRNPPIEQARLIEAAGSPAAAVKATVQAKANRAETTTQPTISQGKPVTPKIIVELRARLREEKAKQRLSAEFNRQLSTDLRITQNERDGLRGKLAAMAKPDDNPATLIDLLVWFERLRMPINIENDVVELSDAHRRVLNALVEEAQHWLATVRRLAVQCAGAEVSAD